MLGRLEASVAGCLRTPPISAVRRPWAAAQDIWQLLVRAVRAVAYPSAPVSRSFPVEAKSPPPKGSYHSPAQDSA